MHLFTRKGTEQEKGLRHIKNKSNAIIYCYRHNLECFRHTLNLKNKHKENSQAIVMVSLHVLLTSMLTTKNMDLIHEGYLSMIIIIQDVLDVAPHLKVKYQ